MRFRQQEFFPDLFGYLVAFILHTVKLFERELFADEKGLAPLYDTIAGHYPTKADEMAIVLTQSNRIDYTTMKNLGFYNSESNFEKERIAGNLEFNFSDVLYEGEGDTNYKVYKCYTNSAYYGLPDDPADLPSVLKERVVECYPELEADVKETDGKYSITIGGEPGTKTIKYVDDPNANKDFFEDQSRKAIECKIVGVLRPTETSIVQLMPPSLARGRW